MDKQIEEMARIIAFDLCPNRHVHAKWGEEAQCYSDNNFAECTKIKNVVDKLYNAGYRKIPENAMVINKDENPCLSCPVPEDLQRSVDCSTICGAVRLGIDWQNQCKVLVKENKQLMKELKQARKETAEKFAERLKENTVDEYDSEGVNHPYVILDYEELDEICKEFTEGNK